jgi:hypothetical protein
MSNMDPTKNNRWGEWALSESRYSQRMSNFWFSTQTIQSQGQYIAVDKWLLAKKVTFVGSRPLLFCWLDNPQKTQSNRSFLTKMYCLLIVECQAVRYDYDFFFGVQWVKVRHDFLFCWYWLDCWLSLFKLSFHNMRHWFGHSGECSDFHNLKKGDNCIGSIWNLSVLFRLFWILLGLGVLDTTLYDKVCQWLALGLPKKMNKTDSTIKSFFFN